MDRTMTPPAQAGASAATAGAAAAGAARPAASRGFMGGMMGGLLGAGLIGALFGAGLFGGLGGFASILGLLLQVALVIGVVMLVMRLFRSRRQGQPAYAGAAAGQGGTNNAFARNAAFPAGGGTAAPKPATMPFNPTPADFQAFEQALVAVNAAWSARDAAALQRLSTAEMARHFAEDHAALQARGWQNETRDVKLEQGDMSEAWHENGQDYATVAMRFSLVDVTRRVADGAVVEGDPAQRITATELWTFVRSTGGTWQLAAIQQAA